MANKNIKENSINKSRKILIVEDSEALSHLVRKRLAREGFSFEHVSTGKEAIKWAEKNEEPILLIDYRLTDMNADKVIEELQKKNIDVNFLIMTGEGDARVAVEMLKLGARDYLFKDENLLELIPLVIKNIFREIDDKLRLKSMEDELKKSNEEYKMLIENANEGIVVVQDKIIKFINSKCIKDTGYSYEEMINRPFSDFIDPKDKDYVLDRFKKRIRGNKIESISRFRILGKNKNVIWVENNAVLIDWDRGKGVLNFFTNITKEKEHDEKINEKEKQYRNLFELSNDAIFIHDKTGKILDVNKKACRMVKFNKDDLLNIKVQDLHVKENIGESKQSIKELIKKNNIKFNSKLQRKDGAQIFVEISANIVDKEKGIIQGIAREITDRIKAENTLKESENKYRSLFNENRDANTITDLDGYIKEYNDAFKKMTGYSDKELKQKTIKDITLPKWQKLENKIIKEQVLKRGYSDVYEKEYLKKDGSIVPVELRVYLLKNIKGEPIGFHGFVRDIQSKKNFEKELEKLNEELEKRVERRTYALEEANKDLESFAYSVSHDLRVPLRHIKGFSDLLSKEILSSANDRAQRYISLISRSIEDMNKLIDDLLLFSRTGRSKLTYNKIKFNNIINEAKAFFEEDIRKKNIIFEADDMPKINCDPLLLKQVMINLISNAVKYTKSKRNPKIKISYENEDKKNDHIVSVKDNGVGFDNNMNEKIFGVFQRAHDNDDQDGTGIGLAIVKRIINKHGGKVWASGSLSKGTEFFFSLPKKN